MSEQGEREAEGCGLEVMGRSSLELEEDKLIEFDETQMEYNVECVDMVPEERENMSVDEASEVLDLLEFGPGIRTYLELN